MLIVFVVAGVFRYVFWLPLPASKHATKDPITRIGSLQATVAGNPQSVVAQYMSLLTNLFPTVM